MRLGPFPITLSMGFNFGSDILAFLLELPDAASFSDLHSPSSSELESCFEFFGRSVDSSRELRGLEPVGLDLDLPLDERARLLGDLDGILSSLFSDRERRLLRPLGFFFFSAFSRRCF